jgi:hypothetical protein
VFEFGIPGDDTGVCHGYGRFGKQFSILFYTVALLRCDRLQRLRCIVAWRSSHANAVVGPEISYLRLLNAVLVVLFKAPSDLTSLNASAYSWLVNAGGAGGANWVPDVKEKGVICPQPGPQACCVGLMRVGLPMPCCGIGLIGHVVIESIASTTVHNGLPNHCSQCYAGRLFRSVS